MDLRRYLPDRTLVWKEWKNNWPVFCVFLGLVTLGSSFSLARNVSDVMQYNSMWGLYGRMTLPGSFDMGSLFDFGSILMTVFAAAAMIGREREQNTFNLLLAMPHPRHRIIYNKFLVGLAQLPVIFGLNALIMSVILWATPVSGLSPGKIWVWAWQYTLILGFIFAFSMLVAALTGTTMGGGFLSLILLLFPYGLTILVGINISRVWDSPIATRWLDVGVLLTPPFYLLPGFGLQDIYPIQYHLPLIFGISGLDLHYVHTDPAGIFPKSNGKQW